MKKVLFVLSAALLLLGSANAQVLEKGEMALVYYMPKNLVVLDFDYTIDTYEAGPYHKYAESLLGITGAIAENRVSYTLQGLHIGSRAVADTERAHKVIPDALFPAQLLTIDKHGLLVGYNLPYQKPAVKQSKDTSGEQCTIAEPVSIPLTDEQLEIRDEKARAQAIAKQIYRIRESRMYLVSGEVEHAPADGKAMQLVLDELKQEENALLTLFVGRHTTRELHKQIVHMPNIEGDTDNFNLYFSEENGFTQAENIEADSISISITLHRQQIQEETGKKKRSKAPQPSQLIYNLPGSADITVVYKDAILAEQHIPMAQLGIDVPLSSDLFTGTQLPVIRFNTRTGNVESISK